MEFAVFVGVIAVVLTWPRLLFAALAVVLIYLLRGRTFTLRTTVIAVTIASVAGFILGTLAALLQ
jgi:hypothetical protein